MQPGLGLAAQLGATLDIRGGSSVLDTALEVAAECNATHIVLGRAGSSWWRRLTGRTLATGLLLRVPDVVVHIIPGSDQPRRKPVHRKQGSPWWIWPGAAAIVAGITAIGVMFGSVAPATIPAR